MKLKTILKQGVIIVCALLFAACSKNSGSGLDGDGGAFSQGLGNAFGFRGQEAGEMYTTKAPHNQIFLFGYDDFTVNSKYDSAIRGQAKYLAAHPGARIMIAGHTDERGSREYNIALGEKRAKAVAEIMRMTPGVQRHQIRVVSYGKEQPVALGHDESSRMQNRRAEVTYEAK